MNTIPKVFLLNVVLLFFAGTLHASLTSTTAYTPGTLYNIDAVSAYETTGKNMDGLSVTVFYKYNGQVGQETQFWADDAGGGKAGGDWWKLTESGTTYSNIWSLVVTKKNYAITGFEISGIGANVVFDVLPASSGSTDGSSNGKSFSISKGRVGTVEAEYSNVVKLLGVDSAVGDLYATLTVSFENSLVKDKPLQFYADTDNVSNLRAVPVPAAVWLLGSGLLGILGMRRKA